MRQCQRINQIQRLATVFDGISRHSPEGMNFKARVAQDGTFCNLGILAQKLFSLRLINACRKVLVVFNNMAVTDSRITSGTKTNGPREALEPFDQVQFDELKFFAERRPPIIPGICRSTIKTGAIPPICFICTLLFFIVYNFLFRLPLLTSLLIAS